MDIRKERNPTALQGTTFQHLSDSSLEEAFIFNTFKKAQTESLLQARYTMKHSQFLRDNYIPTFLHKHIHSQYGFLYFVIANSAIVINRWLFSHKKLKYSRIATHGLIAYGIELYAKTYKTYACGEPQLMRDYDTYNRNCNLLLGYYKDRVSLREELKKLFGFSVRSMQCLLIEHYPV